MALFNCPECGAQISDKAAACPKCGVTINHAPAAVNAPLHRTPRISDRTAVGIIAAMAIIMSATIYNPWLIFDSRSIQITILNWGIAANGAVIAAIGLAFTKQWLATLTAIITSIATAAAACFSTFSDIKKIPIDDMPEYKSQALSIVIFLLPAVIAAIVSAIKLANSNRQEQAARTSWISLACIVLGIGLMVINNTKWCEYSTDTYQNHLYYEMSSDNYPLLNAAPMMFIILGACFKQWIVTAILAAIRVLVSIYILTTDGYSLTYGALLYQEERVIENTSFSDSIYAAIIIAALLFALSVIAERRQRAQTTGAGAEA